MRTAGLLLAFVLLPFVAHASVVNINTADTALLDTLQGIGPTKAAAIVDYRSQHGLFKTIEDIQKVSGIGPVTFTNIKDSITVGAVPAQTSPAPAKVQPPAPAKSSYNQQKVEPAVDTISGAAHDDTPVVAPAVPANIAAAAGAALVPTDTAAGSHLFRSPWTYGFVGVVLIAAAAFIFL